jgi:hypothetical protein
MSEITLGNMKALTYSQLNQYKQAMALFIRVQAYNQIVRNKRLAGNKEISYYTFANNTEETMFTLGQFLLVQNNPTNASLYNLIVKI